MDRKYYVYIMSSRRGVLYVGITNDLARRITEHKEGRGSVFTTRYRVTSLVYCEVFQYVYDAIGREKEIKAWRREKKVSLIRESNPEWIDLSEESWI
ncbi:MAG: GIY-YIG nuclease family protein [FCB group bacterium]|jgi:putative endonuclease|nr:GIY-YIG nuclease family protein [FCB group bacterium]